MGTTERNISLNVLAQMRDFKSKMMRDLPGTSEAAASAAARKMQAVYTREETKRLKAFEANTKKAAQLYSSIMSTAATLFTVAAVKAFGRAFVSMGQDLMDTRNRINDLGDAIGQSNSQLQAFGFAARLSGGNLRQLEPSLKAFPKRLDDFARGTGEARVAFDKLGLTAKQVNKALDEGVDLTASIIDKLQGVANTTQRAALATQVFGESGTRLLQVLGDKSMEDWVELTRKYAVDVGPDAVAASARWEAASGMLAGKFAVLKESIFEAVGGTESFITASAMAIAAMNYATRAAELYGAGVKAWATQVALAGIAARSLATGDLAGMQAALERVGIEARKSASAISALWNEEVDGYAAVRSDLESYMASAGRRALVLGESTAAVEKAAAAEKAFSDAMRANEEAIEDITKAAIDDRIKGIARIEARWQESVDKLDDLYNEDFDNANQIALAKEAVLQRIERDITAFQKEQQQERLDNALTYAQDITSSVTELATGITQIMTESRQRDFDQATEYLDRLRNARKNTRDRIVDMEDEGQKAQARLRVDALNEEIKSQKKRLAERKAALMAAAKAEKKTAIISAVLNGAVAFIKTLASIPFPANVIAAAGIAVTTGITVAKIASTPLPSFFRGGSSGGTTGAMGAHGSGQATLHRDEAVLNARGVRDIGGAGVVEAINKGFAGVSMGGGGASVVYLDGDQVAGAMAVRMRRAGDLRAATTEAGVTGRRLAYRG